MMSSRLGLVAEVMATESPSQSRPVVIQSTWAVMPPCRAGPDELDGPIASSSLSRSAAAGRPRAGPSRACPRTPSRRAPSPAAPSAPLRSRSPRSPPGTARSAVERRVGRSGATDATSIPSLATYIGSMPRISRRPARPGRRARRPRARSSPRPTRAPARSAPTPLRPGWRRACSAAPGRRPRAARPRRPQRARVRLDLGVELELAARQHDRHAVVADRPGHQDAVARPQPGGERRARGSTEPSPVVQMYMPVGMAALDDLGVAGDDLHPGRRARRRRLPRPRPRSTSAAALPPGPWRGSSRPGGRPETARSFTVPLTASSPIEPPGKRNGLDDEAVGRERQPAPSMVDSAGVAHRRRAAGARTPARTAPRSGVWVALPPAPCAMVMCASLELRALRARGLDDVEDRCSRSATALSAPSHDLPFPRETAVVVVRGAGALWGDHAGADRVLRACRRCRRPCTPRA